MNDLNRYVEMIPEYLLGKLNAADRDAFEKQLAESPQLERELKSMARLRSGLSLYERATKDHIASDLLATFATTPELVNKDDLDRINEHLPNCSSCREDLTLCNPMGAAEEETAVQPETKPGSLLSRILAPLWRPVLTAALVLVIAIPFIYYGFQSSPDIVVTATFDIAPVSRDIRSLNKLVITENIDTVGLNFLLAVPDSVNLDCVLMDDEGNIVREWRYEGTHYPVALKLAVSYFDTGIYSLKVRATGSPDENDWFVFRLQVALE